MRTPSSTWPWLAASSRAEPKNAPTQGVQPMENTMPNTSAEKKPSTSP